MAKQTNTSRAAENDGPTSRRLNEKIRVPKVAELVADQIRRRIVRGQLAEGEALLPESALMADFGVSRPTLREAFRILESESLITVTGGSRGGARVHAPDASSVARYAGAFLQYRGTTLEDIEAARAIIERSAARALARRKAAGTCERLRSLIEQERAFEDEPDQFAEISSQFHEQVVELAGNDTLSLVVGMIHDIVTRHAAVTLHDDLDPKITRKIVRSHEKLVSLIEAGDEDGAEEHWRRHITNAGQAKASHTRRKTVIDLFD